MGRLILSALLTAVLVFSTMPLKAYTLQYTDATATKQIHWASLPINITLSTSLQSPPANIKAGSDVVGAARRALSRWEAVSNVRFNVTTSTGDSGSASVDGVNLITASVGGGCTFGSVEQAGKARVRFDPATGNITEADLCLNPSSPFSSDGTQNTFDLESTFVHEIGHMLGLEHSGVVGATMQPRQGRMGNFGVSNFFPVRSLSDDDISGIRSIYGPLAGLGSIAGTVTGTSGGTVFGAHVFAEDVATGRVAAANISLPGGGYRISGLPAGQYRLVVEPLNEPVVAGEIPSAGGAYQGLSTPTPLLTVDVGTFTVTAGGVTNVSPAVPLNSPALNPRFIGINGELSTVPAPLTPGQQTTVYVGGDNMFSVTGISFNSPHITVTSAPQQLTFSFNGAPLQVLAFNVSVAASAPSGDYSLRLATASEIAYVSGGLTIESQGSTATTLAFSQSNYTYREGDAANHVTLTVSRAGDLSAASSVDYATLPDNGLVQCNTNTGLASERCDYTAVRGTLSFSAGESSKTFIVPVTDDSYVEGNETFTVTLAHPVGGMLGTTSSATVTITDNDGVGEPNPIDNAPFFIRQQYLDFLLREPEPEGLSFYLNILSGCVASDIECTKYTRGALSANFFRSPEFQTKGSYVMYLYMVSLGQRPVTPA
ncbi:MAG: Calx-beta domain-containing protein, partial [Pyrinomonadaceae bacterium]